MIRTEKFPNSIGRVLWIAVSNNASGAFQLAILIAVLVVVVLAVITAPDPLPPPPAKYHRGDIVHMRLYERSTGMVLKTDCVGRIARESGGCVYLVRFVNYDGPISHIREFELAPGSAGDDL